MTYIRNTKYITINKDGIFVGGKPATKYRGQEIYDIDYVKHVFELMQAQHPNIAEFQIMASITSGEYARTGNPLPGKDDHDENAKNIWCRIVWNDSSAAPWVFGRTSSSVGICAALCARYCAGSVRGNASFRSAVLGFVAKQPKVIGPKEVVKKQIGPKQM